MKSSRFAQNIGLGLLAGAAGTAALNVVTSLDMTLRGRPASEVPADTASGLAERVGVHALSGEGPAQNRREGAGALFGYVDGLGTGAAYGIVRPALRGVPWLVGAVALTAATLVAGEGTATKVGATDWSKWSLADWISDLLPRATYGIVTALTVDALAGKPA